MKLITFKISTYIPVISNENANATEQLSFISMVLIGTFLASLDNFNSWVLEES